MNFINFKEAVQNKINSLQNETLVKSAISKEDIWNTYLSSFPEGTNPMFRERTEHDCNCCKNFIRDIGGMMAIIDNELVSVWDIEIEEPYQTVAKALSQAVKSHGIANKYLHTEKRCGTDKTPDSATDIIWDHFFAMTPSKALTPKDSIGTQLGHAKSNMSVLQRSLEELTDESVETVIELIEQGSLYRGEEHLGTIKLLKQCKADYANAKNKETELWRQSIKLGMNSKIKNTVIGTLLEDLSNGVELEDAVKMFESKVAPANYKRPKALVTEGMIKQAQKKVEELGIQSSLARRHASINDITINNVLFADRSAKKEMNVFDQMMAETPKRSSKLDKVESVSIDKFISDILPKAESVELMFENKHEKNLVTLVAPVDQNAKSILKWDNNFTWTYNGEVADSLRDQVKSLGGRVDGVLRFSHTWNYDKSKPNQSLMDLHVFTPACGYIESEGKEIHDKYPKKHGRVGWNYRNDSLTGGVQDVDFVNEPNDSIPVENITFPSMSKLPEGKYYFKIHNWNLRHPTQSGFKAEIEFDGEVYEYEYPNVIGMKEWITVATGVLKDGKMTFDHKLSTSKTVKKLWNLNSQNFHKVKVAMLSPNHWDENNTGNKHYFFMLEDCQNPDSVRGFYNEFLKPELNDHRKVFEVLASKVKAGYTEDQLSGLGFSSTKRDELIVKVKGAFERIIKVTF